MMNNVEGMNEQMKQFAELQQRSLEPMRNFGGLAVEAFEHMARKNYELVGDVVDFTVRQSGLPLKGENLDEAMSAQMSESKAFAELMNKRAAEYAELANTLGGKFQQAGTEAAEKFKTA